jgi:hypothetical protein
MARLEPPSSQDRSGPSSLEVKRDLQQLTDIPAVANGRTESELWNHILHGARKHWIGTPNETDGGQLNVASRIHDELHDNLSFAGSVLAHEREARLRTVEMK